LGCRQSDEGGRAAASLKATCPTSGGRTAGKIDWSGSFVHAPSVAAMLEANAMRRIPITVVTFERSKFHKPIIDR
jgi:hypothetical protein